MRIVILGKNGMLGHDLEHVFQGEDFFAYDSKELDVTDRQAVTDTFFTVRPDVVINATGYTNVDKCESEKELAKKVNGYALGVLANACREIDARLVHFSSDYVFNGLKKEGYNEEDGPDPVNAYGRTKLLGEKLLIETMEMLNEEFPKEGKYFLIRTSWLFGHHGKNFVETMLELGKSKKELKVVNDQHGKPTYTMDLCNQVKWLLDSNDYPSGIYHVTNEGVATWYDFAKKIFELLKKDVNVEPCSSDEYPRPAKRPMYSVLNNNQLPPLRSWEEALEDYLNQPK